MGKVASETFFHASKDGQRQYIEGQPVPAAIAKAVPSLVIDDPDAKPVKKKATKKAAK